MVKINFVPIPSKKANNIYLQSINKTELKTYAQVHFPFDSFEYVVDIVDHRNVIQNINHIP